MHVVSFLRRFSEHLQQTFDVGYLYERGIFTGIAAFVSVTSPRGWPLTSEWYSAILILPNTIR